MSDASWWALKAGECGREAVIQLHREYGSATSLISVRSARIAATALVTARCGAFADERCVAVGGRLRRETLIPLPRQCGSAAATKLELDG